MGEETILRQYEYLKMDLEKNGKGSLYNSAVTANLAKFSRALTRILDMNNFTIDTMNGIPVYDDNSCARLVGIASKDDLSDIVGSISFAYDSITIAYVSKSRANEAYNVVSFKDNAMSGTISKVSYDGTAVDGVSFGKEGYRVGEDSYPFASESSESRLTEINNALDIYMRSKNKNYTK